MRFQTSDLQGGHGPAGRGMPLRLLTGVTYLKAKSYETHSSTRNGFGRLRLLIGVSLQYVAKPSMGGTPMIVKKFISNIGPLM